VAACVFLTVLRKDRYADIVCVWHQEEQVEHRSPKSMRVSLPVDTHVKVESEAATIKLVQQHTDIPVPSIIAFDSFNENDLGYEWILIKFMKGQILETAWKTMAWQEKEELVRKVAHYLAQLFKQSFEGIGNVYLQNTGTNLADTDAIAGGTSHCAQSNTPDHRLGEMVARSSASEAEARTL
jgi:aminoglycoside phosphotransferase (APT) family kinase protein